MTNEMRLNEAVANLAKVREDGRIAKGFAADSGERRVREAREQCERWAVLAQSARDDLEQVKAEVAIQIHNAEWLATLRLNVAEARVGLVVAIDRRERHLATLDYAVLEAQYALDQARDALDLEQGSNPMPPCPPECPECEERESARPAPTTCYADAEAALFGRSAPEPETVPVTFEPGPVPGTVVPVPVEEETVEPAPGRVNVQGEPVVEPTVGAVIARAIGAAIAAKREAEAREPAGTHEQTPPVPITIAPKSGTRRSDFEPTLDCKRGGVTHSVKLTPAQLKRVTVVIGKRSEGSLKPLDGPDAVAVLDVFEEAIPKGDRPACDRQWTMTWAGKRSLRAVEFTVSEKDDCLRFIPVAPKGRPRPPAGKRR